MTTGLVQKLALQGIDTTKFMLLYPLERSLALPLLGRIVYDQTKLDPFGGTDVGINILHALSHGNFEAGRLHNAGFTKVGELFSPEAQLHYCMSSAHTPISEDDMLNWQTAPVFEHARETIAKAQKLLAEDGITNETDILALEDHLFTKHMGDALPIAREMLAKDPKGVIEHLAFMFHHHPHPYTMRSLEMLFKDIPLPIPEGKEAAPHWTEFLKQAIEEYVPDEKFSMKAIEYTPGDYYREFVVVPDRQPSKWYEHINREALGLAEHDYHTRDFVISVKAASPASELLLHMAHAKQEYMQLPPWPVINEEIKSGAIDSNGMEETMSKPEQKPAGANNDRGADFRRDVDENAYARYLAGQYPGAAHRKPKPQTVVSDVKKSPFKQTLTLFHPVSR